jgi:hypothetical protein
VTASRLEIAAWHESAHAVVCEVLGGHVRMITIGHKRGATWYATPTDPAARAAVLWAGPIGESLKFEALRPAEFLCQPDYDLLATMPVHHRNQGFELAEQLLLGTPEHATAVRAVAAELLRRRSLRGTRRLPGWRVRSIMANPPPPEPAPGLELGFAGQEESKMVLTTTGSKGAPSGHDRGDDPNKVGAFAASYTPPAASAAGEGATTAGRGAVSGQQATSVQTGGAPRLVDR